MECDLNVANCHIHQALIRINISDTSRISDFSVGWVSDVRWMVGASRIMQLCMPEARTHDLYLSRWRPLNRFDWKATCASHTRWPQINNKFMFTWAKHSIREFRESFDGRWTAWRNRCCNHASDTSNRFGFQHIKAYQFSSQHRNTSCARRSFYRRRFLFSFT